MVTFYKEVNGRIVATTPFEDVAQDWGVPYLSTEKEIVRAPDGGLCFKGEEPADVVKEYKIREKKAQRNVLLQELDPYVLPDYPITAEQLEKVKGYRQYLRDLPKAAGFPDVDILTLEEWSA